MGKSPKQRLDRRAAAEELRRAQQAAARRRMVLTVSVTAVIALGLVAAVAVPAVLGGNDQPSPALAAVGAPAAEADCRTPISEPGQGANDHVAPGVRIDYQTAPPASGRHDGQYLTNPRHFYTPDDRPSVEKLVHSLEHGYTIVWYDESVPDDQLTALRELTEQLPTRDNPGRWFMVAPWTAHDAADRGAFPAGTHVALTHWGRSEATRQYCAQVSGEAVLDFVEEHPAADAPEPGGM